jgi:2-oxoglutarate dehydrogenase E2 component (dihydrolipoamide succinyltransferase)
MPQMGESIAEGTIIRWLKKVGEAVERDEPIFEISTDKVDAEIPAPQAGTLSEIKVPEGETVEVDTVVATIETDAGAAADAKPADDAGEKPAKEAKSAEKEKPGKEEESSGKPAKEAKTAGKEEPEEEAAGGKAEARPAPDRRKADAGEMRQVRSSPVVRKIAAEHDVDLSRVNGSGIGGRVTKKDILAFVESGAGAGAPERPSAATPAGQRPAASSGMPGRREPMSIMRKKIAEHMVASRRTSAHVTTLFEVDFTHVARQRKQTGEAFLERNGVKLTYTPILAAAIVDSLKEFPVVNASIDGDDIVYHPEVNLGIAVALEQGLIVPVVKRADELNLVGLARAITDLAHRARNKKLTPDDVQGGTFTLTNPGQYGAQFGTPIINQPQVAILGAGAIEKRPVVIDDAIAIRTMCYLSLSFDHRLIDGATADQFMAYLKKRLETMQL